MSKLVISLTGGASPLFAWRLPREIATYKQPRLQAQQWIHIIASLGQKGIKQSEIDDCNVVDWLKEQDKRQVSREELAEFVSLALPSIKEARLSGSDTRYRSYSFATPHEEYHESLFYFPTVVEDLQDRINELDDKISSLNFDFEALGRDPDLVFRLDAKRQALFDQTKSDGVELRTHFSHSLKEMCPDARADFAHMRWSIKVDGSERTLFVHELQSDWAQRGRKQEWRGEYKKAPLVGETEHWTSFLLRRAMLLAVENRCTQLTWISGAAMANGGNAYGAPGLDEFYRKIVPSLAKKFARPFQSELVLKEFVLNDQPRSMAVMPITDSMRENFSCGAPVYSYARVVESASFDPVRAAQLQKALQLRADSMHGRDVGMRVAVVQEIMDAFEQGRPAASLVGRTATIAFDAKDPVAALDHEGFHLAYRYHFTSRQRAEIDRQFSSGAPLLVRTVNLLMMRGEYKAAEQALTSPEEAAAHAYSLWTQNQMPISRLEELATDAKARRGVREMITQVFPKVKELVASICSWIRGSGTSPTDFFAKIVRAHGAPAEADDCRHRNSDLRESQDREDAPEASLGVHNADQVYI